ncbi:MAG: hypothetical protein R2711_18285 [Acidimicrobiales bacterium]
MGFIAVLIVADLLLVHRTAHEITFKEAAIESSVWIAIGVAFTGVIFAWHGGQAAGEYISGYLIEKSLSIDNVFVWAVIFSYFAVPKAYQFRTLFWGIFGALILRAIFIFAGVALIEAFEWVLRDLRPGAALQRLEDRHPRRPGRCTRRTTRSSRSSTGSSRPRPTTTARSCSRSRTGSASPPRCSPC